MLKIKTEQVIRVFDWDRLVEETYGRPYSFQQQDGCKERQRVYITVPDEAQEYEDDNFSEMGVSFATWLKRDPSLTIDGLSAFSTKLWWYRNFYPDVQVVANDLHAKGLLPAGDYTIDIDW